MTAIRNFPDAARVAAVPWPLAGWARRVWDALHRYGRRRAAFELEAQAQRWSLGNPGLAKQLRDSAAECRREAHVEGRTV
jgi:hypothetical protein